MYIYNMCTHHVLLVNGIHVVRMYVHTIYHIYYLSTPSPTHPLYVPIYQHTCIPPHPNHAPSDLPVHKRGACGFQDTDDGFLGALIAIYMDDILTCTIHVPLHTYV